MGSLPWGEIAGKNLSLCEIGEIYGHKSVEYATKLAHQENISRKLAYTAVQIENLPFKLIIICNLVLASLALAGPKIDKFLDNDGWGEELRWIQRNSNARSPTRFIFLTMFYFLNSIVGVAIVAYYVIL